MWKKKVAAALSMTFLAGSLTFGSTASAYIINVGMEDLAAQEKAADSGEKQEKKAENAKEHGNAKDEKKKEVKDFQEKKAETSVKKEDKKAENSDTKKTIEEAAKASVTPVPQKREEEQKPLVSNKKKEETKPSVQKKVDESKVPLQGKKMEAPVQANKDAVKTKNKKNKEFGALLPQSKEQADSVPLRVRGHRQAVERHQGASLQLAELGKSRAGQCRR